MTFLKMNSEFTLTPSEHSSKCGTKQELHSSIVSPLVAEPTDNTTTERAPGIRQQHTIAA
jgi:hypothetical protein